MCLGLALLSSWRRMKTVSIDSRSRGQDFDDLISQAIKQRTLAVLLFWVFPPFPIIYILGIVKVFDRELRTSAHALRGALNWCLKSGMDIVNLSLGSTNPANADMFRHIAAKASAAGMLLVSARQAEGVDCYPGCLPGVFAVEADWDLPRDSYTFNHDATRGTITIRASGYPRPVPGVPPNRNLLGVSFGVANACGFIVQACHEAGPLGTGPDRASRICQILAARLP
jgi:hypothetical protein